MRLKIRSENLGREKFLQLEWNHLFLPSDFNVLTLLFFFFLGMIFVGLLLTIVSAVASVVVCQMRALCRWAASLGEAESGHPDVDWPAIVKVNWMHWFELFFDKQGLERLCECVSSIGLMVGLDRRLGTWGTWWASWSSGWCFARDVLDCWQ